MIVAAHNRMLVMSCIPSIAAIAKIIANICRQVLIFPDQPAAITIPRSAAISRSPLTTNSREIITTVIQAGITCKLLRQTRAAQTNNLSANGSINLPKFVTRLFFRAICPSKKSVMQATAKIANATQFCPGKLSGAINTTTKNGISTMRAMVNLFGRFTLSPPWWSRFFAINLPLLKEQQTILIYIMPQNI